MKPCVLLDMWQLFEPALAVWALVRLLPRVNPANCWQKGIKKRTNIWGLLPIFDGWHSLNWPDVLDQLVVAWERLQTLLTLMRLHLGQFSINTYFNCFLQKLNFAEITFCWKLISPLVGPQALRPSQVALQSWSSNTEENTYQALAKITPQTLQQQKRSESIFWFSQCRKYRYQWCNTYSRY